VFLADEGYNPSMNRSSDLMTTGQAAAVLGCSRQHVVDLCARGDLPSTSVGTHRRVRRADVERLASGGDRRSSRPEQLRSLWLHRAVAGRLARDPERVLARAYRNLDRLQRMHPSGMSAAWLARWRRLLDEGPEAAMRALVDESPEADELRQNSPFAGVLTETERLAILRAARRHGAGSGARQ
jgi:excisionase family DNA binding protein